MSRGLLEMRGPLAWLATLILVLSGVNADAQIEIRLQLKHDLYIQYGEVDATVTIRNLAGRDVFFDNEPDKPWLAFRLKHDSGRMVPMTDPFMKFPPLLIKSGETLKRSVDINRIFSMEMLGQYSLVADLYFLGTETYITSNREVFNVIQGHRVWERILGVPGSSGERRKVSVYTHRLVDRVYLYMGITNPDGPQVFCMRRLGRYASYAKQIAVDTDSSNRIHVLHLAAPRTFLYTVTDLNGNLLSSEVYVEGNSRPRLVNNGGSVKVGGGSVRSASDPVAGQPPLELPRISERPVTFE